MIFLLNDWWTKTLVNQLNTLKVIFVPEFRPVPTHVLTLNLFWGWVVVYKGTNSLPNPITAVTLALPLLFTKCIMTCLCLSLCLCLCLCLCLGLCLCLCVCLIQSQLSPWLQPFLFCLPDVSCHVKTFCLIAIIAHPQIVNIQKTQKRIWLVKKVSSCVWDCNFILSTKIAKAYNVPFLINLNWVIKGISDANSRIYLWKIWKVQTASTRDLYSNFSSCNFYFCRNHVLQKAAKTLRATMFMVN